ncbi:MAG TPA: hypothetical protein VNY51_07075 [Candidatus Dormibacteraeota bacterium]|jgi:hypothetical protein|nr:hypothetical protein [Candidatus Dormibacteraeota bacterium]
MKKISLLLILIAATAWAQTEGTTAGSPTPQGSLPTTASFPIQRVQMPTYADVYCAGFINRQSLPDANFVAGGLNTPTTTKFVKDDIVYLQGTGYNTGAEYEIVRALKDVNEYELFPGQAKLLKATGQPYAEVGRVRIIDTRSRAAVAQIEYSCDPINPGDTAIPFTEKSMIAFHPPMRFDRFLPTSSKVSGRIVMARDFDSELGTGQKVYFNVGANQGVKVGDYFRATRQYEADLHDPVDSLSFKAALSEDTQKKQASVDPNFLTKSNGPIIHVRDLPRRAVAEVVVIGTTPTTATGMIVFAMEDVHAGDDIELDDQQAQ